MANEKRMDQVILGFLSHEPMTGYEIKKRIDTSLHYFWSGSYGSIYPTLNDLEKNGLVTKAEDKANARKKLIYQITDAGREALREWLKMPVVKNELRYETLLKLFFGKELGKEGVLQHISDFEESIKKELPFLEMCKAQLNDFCDVEDHRYYMLTVQFGIETYKGYLKWCEEARNFLNSYE